MEDPTALYVHIPFCKHKCHYCDFNTYEVEGQPVNAYLEALEMEMKRTVEATPPPALESIFIGGGTPTILDAQQMERLLASLQTYFPRRQSGYEFTMEANPGTVDKHKLEVMKEGGVNRISFGAQTFDDGLLKKIGRIHDRDQVYQSIHNAKSVGFENLSIDLMFGLPGQTVDHMRESLERALELDLQHYSLYSLKIEEHTLFHTLYERGELMLPAEEEEAEMYEMIMDRLSRAGYVHYEISNFAKPGFESRHNQKYWLNHSYYGLGAGAHGYVRGVRHVNVKGIKDYVRMSQTSLPVKESTFVSEEEAMEDFMMVGLRLLRGVRQKDFRAQFHRDMESVFGEPLTKLLANGLLERTGDGYKLTEKGLWLGNEVFGEFLNVK